MPLLIRCTQKLLREIPKHLIEPSLDGAGWHATLLRIERRKCVLFTHDATLYSVFVPGLKKPEFDNLPDVFGQCLFKTLLWEQFPQAHIEVMLEAGRVMQFSKTNSRSVLGSMNDIQFQAQVYIHHDGGLANADMVDLHRRLNRVPMSAIGYRYAVERLRELLTEPQS
jgi:hypothetical protein